MPIGFIAGTGFEAILSTDNRRRMTTPFGRFDYFVSNADGEEIITIPRHGVAHEFSPFRMPTKAQLFGLRSLGVLQVIACSSVASANTKMLPGHIVLPDQFIDLTKNRDSTFYHFDVTVHTDMTEPFCNRIRELIISNWVDDNIVVHNQAVYAATEGPRYQTPAEIRMIQILEGDIVGQSAVTEAVLAKELGLCYTLIAVVSSRAAGLQEKKESRDILDSIWSRGDMIRPLLLRIFPLLTQSERTARCKQNEFEAERLLMQIQRSSK